MNIKTIKNDLIFISKSAAMGCDLPSSILNEKMAWITSTYSVWGPCC